MDRKFDKILKIILDICTTYTKYLNQAKKSINNIIRFKPLLQDQSKNSRSATMKKLKQ